METLQDLVAKGQLKGMQVILDNSTAAKTKKLALCRDQSGVGLLHKAVFYDHQDIVRYLLDYNPATASLKDK
ncbi:unnamed protein product, partial [Timema podura]|nr:unnamed protein product [Timema podura]